MWWKTAVPGDKIVCINDVDNYFNKENVVYEGTLDGLTKGVIYTVRLITINEFDDDMVVALEEIERPITSGFYWSDQGYSVFRFKPVEKNKTKTGMKILNKILVSSRIKENA